LQHIHSTYLIGLREEWVFSQPFDTQPIEVAGEGWNNNIDPTVVDENYKETIKILLEIVAAGQHADTSSST
jgi:hypothetical protein